VSTTSRKTLRLTRKPESKKFKFTQIRRQQNRESAVRSRMRKKVYQEELEDGVTVQSKFQQELMEKMAALEAENNLLKNQVNYFENLFASSSLAGSEAPQKAVSRDELELFKQELVRKINPDLLIKEEEKPEVADLASDSLVQHPTDKESKDFEISSNGSLKTEFRLKRQSST
jgi:hypothetical protein